MVTKAKMLSLVGERLRYYRNECGYTQQQLSELVDLSMSYYSDIERGVKSVSVTKLVDLINALNCTADDIFEDLLDRKYDLKISRLNAKIENLSAKDKRKLIAVIDAFIETK